MADAVIDRFAGEYRFLSNFFPVRVRYPTDDPDAPVYRTLEHAFQAAKSLDPEERERVRNTPSPGVAKGIGRHIGNRRPDWSAVRIDVMRDLLRAKFAEDPMRSRLLETGDAELVEGNLWHDHFWGSCRCAKHAGTTGLNLLGRLLMEVRDELAGKPVVRPVTAPAPRRRTAAGRPPTEVRRSAARRSASPTARVARPRG